MNRVDKKWAVPVEENILLLLLPFWTALIPPLGISCLKSYLQEQGYKVKALDANIETGFREIYDQYFEILHDHIPENKRGNFFNIGIDVLQNHMMALFNYKDEFAYITLVKKIIFKTFYSAVDESVIRELNQRLQTFYERLDKYLIDLLAKEKPALLGLSVFKGVLPASLFALKRTKEEFPHIRTVMGGGIFVDQIAVGSPNFEFLLEKAPYIDHVILGEGEILFLKLLQGDFPPSKRVITSADIAGQVLDLSTAPLPDFSDLSLQYYPNLASYASRSCPYQCSFCSETVNWGKYRKKKAKKVVAEMKRLSEVEHYQLFLLSDSLLNPILFDLAREMIKSELSLYWDGYLRADESVCCIDNTLLLRQGGFYRARLGLESGSMHVLELMNKKITSEQIKVVVSGLAAAGIKTTTYWVIGHPGETEDDFRQTLAIVEELKDDIYEVDCNPFRYHYYGQVNSGKWRCGKVELLYPEDARDMLIAQTWIIADSEPSREETYTRLNRFLRHCKALGIPNPYSWQDIARADERWKQLHRNAVPPLLDFRERGRYIDENKSIIKQHTAEDLLLQEDGDFDF